MKKSLPFIIVIVAVVTALFLYSQQNPKTVPMVKFSDIDGQQHAMQDYLGKPTLVIFWATDCPGCIQEIPDLKKVYKDFSPDQLNMLAVAFPHDTVPQIKAMREKRQLPYTITWDNTGAISRAFDNVRVTPTHFLVTAEGEIIMRKIGTMKIDLLYEKLNKLGLQAS
jgi:peroxiredoxin